MKATKEDTVRIWFLPQAYWQITEEMPQKEADDLMAEVEAVAAKPDLEAIRTYSFVCIGESCHRRARELDPK